MRGSREKRWRRRVMRTWTGVEEVVVAPEGQEDVLGGDDAAAAFA